MQLVAAALLCAALHELLRAAFFFMLDANTLQPHYNTVVYSTNSGFNTVEAWLPLPILPMYNSLIITLFCYNIDYTMDPENSVIMRLPLQCSSSNKLQLRFVELHFVELRFVELRCDLSSCVALCRAALRFVELSFVELRCNLSSCAALCRAALLPTSNPT